MIDKRIYKIFVVVGPLGSDSNYKIQPVSVLSYCYRFVHIAKKIIFILGRLLFVFIHTQFCHYLLLNCTIIIDCFQDKPATNAKPLQLLRQGKDITKLDQVPKNEFSCLRSRSEMNSGGNIVPIITSKKARSNAVSSIYLTLYSSTTKLNLLQPRLYTQNSMPNEIIRWGDVTHTLTNNICGTSATNTIVPPLVMPSMLF